MPEAFEKCVERGGKVRRKRIDKNHWMNFCIPPGGGKGDSVAGELHTYKKATKKKIYKVNRKLPYFGEADEEKKQVTVNPKKGEVVNTVIHEEEHLEHPKMREKNIRKKAVTREKKMPIRKQIKLLQKLL